MKKIFLGLFCLLFLLATACKSEYEKTVTAELAKGEVYTDLPMGLKTGITKKEYFDICWKMNKDKTISNGPGNEYAKFYLLPEGETDSLQTVIMLFYGMFDEAKIMRGMDMIMEFKSWAPWNKDFHSPALMKMLETHYLKTYPGNKFFTIKVKDDLNARVKVDGNRRITMYPLSKQKVAVKIVDLRHEDLIVK